VSNRRRGRETEREREREREREKGQECVTKLSFLGYSEPSETGLLGDALKTY
jgi:hypothetical protein